MKKVLFYPFALLFAASVIFTGCRSDDAPTPDPEYIVVENPDLLEQNVYADEDADESGVRITTLAPWRSEITDVTSRTSTVTRNTADWVSISPESGGIGTYTIVINLEPNFSGNDRSAVIAIISDGTTIRISITQQGVTEEGEVPIDHSIIRAENVLGDYLSHVVTVGVREIGKAPFQDNGFTLQLNSVPESWLWNLACDFSDNNVVVSDRNARGFQLLNLEAFDINSNHIGSLFLYDENYWARWLYVDRDVTIRGTDREECCCWSWEMHWDMDLRRGWNIVYYYYGEEREAHTTRKPARANLRWEFQITGATNPFRLIVENPESLRQIVDEDAVTGEYTVRFFSPMPWTSSIGGATRSSEESCLTISPESGGAGHHEITLTFTPNTEYYRHGVINITNGYSSFQIHITHRGPLGERPPWQAVPPNGPYL